MCMSTYLDIDMALVFNQEGSIVRENPLVVKLRFAFLHCYSCATMFVDGEARLVKRSGRGIPKIG